MTNFTIVPDVHADPTRLDFCLSEAGNSKIIFLGDLIDAGARVLDPDDHYVVKKVKELIDNGRALAVMGNHELNAILFHRQDSQGKALREHSETNCSQHRSFLDQFGKRTPIALNWTEWFLTLPLWIEQDGLRIVHACWDDGAVKIIKERRPDGRLKADDLEEVARKETAFARAVETLTSGVELKLPNGHQFSDGKGVVRKHVRLAWWLANHGTWREAALSVPNIEELPNSRISVGERLSGYPTTAAPVFVGHYKMKGKPQINHEKVGCLDYPDFFCVYHWSGEQTLSSENLRSRTF